MHQELYTKELGGENGHIKFGHQKLFYLKLKIDTFERETAYIVRLMYGIADIGSQHGKNSNRTANYSSVVKRGILVSLRFSETLNWTSKIWVLKRSA